MRLEPNERILVKKEHRKETEFIWNRTDKPITVYYTSKGIEVHGFEQVKSLERKKDKLFEVIDSPGFYHSSEQRPREG